MIRFYNHELCLQIESFHCERLTSCHICFCSDCYGKAALMMTHPPGIWRRPRCVAKLGCSLHLFLAKDFGAWPCESWMPQGETLWVGSQGLGCCEKAPCKFLFLTSAPAAALATLNLGSFWPIISHSLKNKCPGLRPAALPLRFGAPEKPGELPGWTCVQTDAALPGNLPCCVS